MNSSKSDVIKHSQAKGATSGENEPLFPRLHINETEKAGPRAPPRNKMALYEQLTVPSHRFVQRSGTTNTNSHQEHQVQYRSSEYRHPYAAYYVQSPLACAKSQHLGPIYPRPAYGISSGDMSCDSTVLTEDEAQRVPGQHEQSASLEVSKRMRKDVAIASMRSKSEKKSNVASDHSVVVPYTTAHGKKLLCTKPVSQQQQCHGNTGLVKLTPNFKGPNITNSPGIPQETLNVVDVGPGHLMSESQCSGLPGIDQSDENMISVIAECDTRQNVHGSQEEQDDSAGSLDLPVQSCQQSTLVDEAQLPECQSVTEPETSHEYGNTVEYRDLKKGDENLLPGRSAVISTIHSSLNEQQAVLTEQSIPRHQENGDESKSVIANMVQSLHDISGGTKNSYKANELSSPLDRELSQPGIEKDSNSDDTLLSTDVLVPELTIKPKDVIRTIGQQQFWKARKALLRQQRIFSEQVFQLHKLIKVQQLLAETPGVLMDEQMQFGALEESGESPCSNLVERTNCASEKEQNMVPSSRGGAESPLQETEGNPEVVSNNTELREAASNEGGLNPSTPASSHGFVSAWGYPSVGQWMGPMDAQGRPFMYHPFSGPPFGGPYGAPMPGPIPPMVPFGIPYYGQILSDMHQNYGSATSSNKFDPSAGHTPINVPKGIHGSWNFAPYGVYPPGFSKDVPTGSGASVNKSSRALTGTSTSSVPGMHYQFGMNAHQIHQSKNSSSSSLLQRPSKVKKSCYEHQEKKSLESRGVHGSRNAKFQENDRSLGEEESASNVPKDLHGKEDSQASGRNIMFGKSIEHAGWQLFPLVSLDDRERTKKGKPDERQGRVIKAVPHPAISTTQSAAGILLSLQRERQQ